MLSRINHSLSAKLLLLFICAGAVLLLLAGSILGKGFSQHFRHSIRPFMAHYIELMEQELGYPPSQQQARQISRNIPVDIHVFGPDGNWSTGLRQLDRSQLLEQEFDRKKRPGLNRLSKRFNVRRFDDQLVLQTREGEYEVYFQIYDRRGIGRGGPFGLILILSIFAILLLIYYATRALFKPIQDIEEGVKRIGDGDLGHRISKRRNDQLGDLTDSVNAMADDISNMLEAKRQMLLGISHELRSPLTRSRVNLELLPDSSAKTEVKKDIDAMEELITELLESERLNSRHAKLQIDYIDILDLVSELLSTEFESHPIESDLQSVQVEVDVLRIKLLVRNLLQNAIKYSSDSSQPPIIRLNESGDGFSIEVEDHGEGIEQEHIRHLTEPFYRADPSRQRKTGGYGLGLYLCRQIIGAHNGQIGLTPDRSQGTEVWFRLPLAP